MNALTWPFAPWHSAPVAEKEATGFDSLTGAVMSRNVSRNAAFLSPDVPSMGGSGGEPQGSPVLHRSVNPPDSAHPFDSGERSANQTGAHHMNAITLAVNNGRITTTSHAVAQHFGKRHDNVIQAIERLECSDGFRLLNFQETSNVIAMPNGGSREEKSYEITKDGFAFLCMGFTGKKAAEWKEKYIDAFNAMEAGLQQKQPNAALPHYITQEQAGAIVALIAERFPEGKHRPYAWSRFANHFKLAGGPKGEPAYKFLPASRFDEALAYLAAMPAKEAPALPAPAPAPSSSGITITLSDLGGMDRALLTKIGPHALRIDFLPNEARILTSDEDLPALIKEAGQVSRALLPAIISSAAGRLV
jgi:Rha family phage regulatory protein